MTDDAFTPISPVRNPETTAFWDAAREGRLLLKQCDECREIFFYPRDLCPFCLSESAWVESSGLGTVYSHSRVKLGGGDYMLAMVSLAEGPTVMTNILAADLSAVAIGQPVRVTFIDTDGEEKLPVFTPV